MCISLLNLNNLNIQLGIYIKKQKIIIPLYYSYIIKLNEFDDFY